jgi:hypothetical protein
LLALKLDELTASITEEQPINNAKIDLVFNLLPQLLQDK